MKFSVSGSSVDRAARQETAGAVSRHSSGLEQFCSLLKSPEGQSILDMSGVSQANITFITGLGHRISSEDIVENVLQAAEDRGGEQAPAAGKEAQFLEQTLTFPEASFDGVLVWDALQFLAPPLVNGVVERLLRVMRPGGIILAFFNANDKIKEIPVYRYRIQDAKTLQQLPRGGTLAVQNFNNRSIEKLFEAASSVKFFLTRDSLREVLIRR